MLECPEMTFIRSSRDGYVATLCLDRAKANALELTLVDELSVAVESLEADDRVRALVLGSALPRLFCAGFDVAEVFAYDQPRMLAFFTRFVRLFERLTSLRMPVVAALSGHAFAGGAILALAADFRVMSASATLSVNEVDLAVELPSGMLRAMASQAGPELMRSMLLGAEVVNAERALSAGLVSEVVEEPQVLERALVRARALGAKPQAAFAAHKRALQPPEPWVVTDADIAHTIGVWFGAEATERRQALQSRLRQASRRTSE
jgi:enoyl-CoA hydratase/carnithine racemase